MLPGSNDNNEPSVILSQGAEASQDAESAPEAQTSADAAVTPASVLCDGSQLESTPPVVADCSEQDDSHSVDTKATQLSEGVSPVAPEVPTAPAGDDCYAFPASSDDAATALRLGASAELSSDVAARGDDVLNRSKSVGRLYPELSEVRDERQSMRPFTEEQILMLYENAWLKERTAIVSDFVSLNKERHLNHHELYKLLENYLHSRELLATSTCALHSFQQDIAKQEAGMWDIVPDVVSGKGRCADNKRVTGEHYYQRALYNNDAASLMTSSAQELLKLLKEKHLLHMHNAAALRVQVDYYFQLVLDTPQFRDMPKNAPVSSGTQADANVAELKACISVLFVFLRKAMQDAVFVSDVQSWLRMLASLLLRVASLADHFFLLNHVVRCPPGIHKWAINMVQVPSPVQWPMRTDWHQATLGCQQLDYALAVLTTILSPVEAREEYLQHLQSVFEAASGQEAWVMLDSDGEEDDAPSVIHWRENDVVALLNQVPFAGIFQHLLFVVSENYDATRASEQDVLKMIAVASRLVSILHTGLKTYNRSRYKQLTKRISRLVRHTVQYVSDHWRSFQSMQGVGDSAMLIRLQVEYDQFVLRAVNCIFYSQSMGAWQFMAVLPYSTVSTAMLWQLLWLLHNSYQENEQQVHLSPSDICEKLQDKVHKLGFEENLSRMPQSEVFFLMTSFANMAASRGADGRALTHMVALEIFEMTYLNRKLRQLFAKEGRDLLSSLAQKQPGIVSVLLDAIDDHMMALGVMACYLMQAMPLHLWLPGKEDLDIISHFLLYYPLNSPQSQLARLLIENLNYGFTEQGQLFLEYSLHQQLALLLLEAYEKLCAPYEVASYVYKQVRYLSYLATGTCESSTPTGFVAWSWNILFQLKLHAFDCNHRAQLSLVVDENPPVGVAPDPEKCEWLHPILKACKDLSPPALFLSLSIGSAGHYREEVLTTGLKSISTLVVNEQCAAAVKCISNVLPLFYMRQELLTTNQKFLADLRHLVLADNTYLTAAKSLMGSESSAEVLKQLAATMVAHVSQAKHWGLPSLPIKLWISLLCHLPDIPMNRAAHKPKGKENVMFLLDILVQLAYFEADCFDSVVTHLKELLANLAAPQASQSMMKTVFLYVLGSQAASWPSMVPFQSAPAFPWFALAGMLAEAQLPEIDSAWKTVLSAATQSPQTSVEAIVKKAMQAPLEVLLLYRWAHQALQTDADHPALPLIWQQFFSLYLQRCPNGSSVGPRFFESATYFALLKKMKRRLIELADHFYQKCASTSEQGAPRDLWEKLLKMYRTFGLWLEEPRLQGACINFGALPSQYCPEALCTIIAGSSQLWHDLVPTEVGQRELQSLQLPKQPRANRPCRNQQHCEPAPEERIVSRLKTYEGPMPAPPVPTFRPVIPPVPCLASQVKELVSSQLRVLMGQASTVTGQLDKLASLDRVCREELLPVLYDNVPAYVQLSVPCDYQGDCKGPLHLRLQFYEARLAPDVSHKVDRNRTEWVAALTELQRPPPHASCCALVQLEACITQLVQRHRKATPAIREELDTLGSEVFFSLVGALHKEMVDYAPTRQFVTLCLDMVGEEFVSHRANQCVPVLQAILNEPSRVGHMAPFFSPAAANQEQYALMYQSVSSCLVPTLYNAVFVLLSKFDLPRWLTNSAPGLAVRAQLLESVEKALCKCGLDPPQPLLPLVEVFHSHLHSLLQFHFPEHYAVVLNMLLRGVESGSLPVATWSVFLQALGYGRPEQAVQAYDEEYAKRQCLLSLAETTVTISTITSHFTALRNSDASIAKSGLYRKTKPFLPVLCRFFSAVAHCYIWENLKVPNECLEEAVKAVLQLYGPWLELAEGKSVYPPWLPVDGKEATYMAHTLVRVLAFFHRCCHDTWNVNVLSLVWQHYFLKYVWTDPPEYVAAAMQTALGTLPWSQFFPSVDDMKLARKVLDPKYSSHLAFLVQVFVQVPWQERLHQALQLQPEQVVKYHACFAELVVGLAWHPDMVEFVANRLGALREHEWGLLPGELVCQLQKKFACSCDTHHLLKPGSGTDRTVLEFVATLSCMVPGRASDLQKQHGFVSTVVGLYGPALGVAHTQDVALLLPQLLDQCESVLGPVSLLGRALSLLDSCREGSPQEQALLGGLTPWLEARQGYPVLLAVLAATCTHLASVRQLVYVAEACLAAFLEGSAAPDGGWEQAAAAFRVPELTLAEFRSQCTAQAAHLTQLCYLLHCLPHCRSPEDERALLDQLADWVSQGRAAGEDTEPKLLLLWAKLLVLSLRQLDFGGDPQAVSRLLGNFCSTLTVLGEDRDTGGLLGALGMGRRSTVSARFRFCCRAVAAFVAARLTDNTVLAGQCLSRLQALQGAKAYLPFTQEIQEAVSIVQDSSCTLRDSLHLIQILVNFFYCEKAYLRILFFGTM